MFPTKHIFNILNWTTKWTKKHKFVTLHVLVLVHYAINYLYRTINDVFVDSNAGSIRIFSRAQKNVYFECVKTTT